MSKEDDLRYSEVAEIANRLKTQGKRVTLEYLRRELGKGTHAKIAYFLSRWQRGQKNDTFSSNPKYKSNGTGRRLNHETQAGRPTSVKRPDVRFKGRNGNSGSSPRPSPYANSVNRSERKEAAKKALGEGFSFTRLAKEPAVIQKLFLALQK